MRTGVGLGRVGGDAQGEEFAERKVAMTPCRSKLQATQVSPGCDVRGSAGGVLHM